MPKSKIIVPIGQSTEALELYISLGIHMDTFHILIAAREKGGKKTNIIEFFGASVELDAPNVIAICDAETAELGEMAFQLLTHFSKEKDGQSESEYFVRRPVKFNSVGLFSSNAVVHDAEWLTRPGLLREALVGAAGFLARRHGYKAAYFVFLGNENQEEDDAKILEAACVSKIENWRCNDAMNCGDECYIITCWGE